MASATHRLVNGVEVLLTPAEVAATEADWALSEPGTGALWLAAQAAEVQSQRTVAKSVFAAAAGDPQGMAKAQRAALLLILDRTHNALATKINAILTAIDSAATLAQVKTNIAAIADAPTYTATQLKTALRNLIDAGDADG